MRCYCTCISCKPVHDCLPSYASLSSSLSFAVLPGTQRSSPLPSSPERPVITKETTMKPHKPQLETQSFPFTKDQVMRAFTSFHQLKGLCVWRIDLLSMVKVTVFSLMFLSTAGSRTISSPSPSSRVLHSHKSSQLSSSTPPSPPSPSRGNTSPAEKESVKSTAEVPPSTPQQGECVPPSPPQRSECVLVYCVVDVTAVQLNCSVD